LTAEVRDRYNNPQSGTDVEFSTTTGTFAQNGGTSRTVTTDSDGHASVQFESDTSGEIEASINGGVNAELNTTTFTVDVGQAGGSGNGTGGNDEASCVTGISADGSGGSDSYRISYDIQNTGSCEDITLTDFKITYSRSGSGPTIDRVSRREGDNTVNREYELTVSPAGTSGEEGQAESEKPNNEGFLFGTMYSLSETGKNAVIPSGANANVNVGYFYDGRPNSGDPILFSSYDVQTSEPSEPYLSISFYFSDGSKLRTYVAVDG
jgi:hypothetical protein